jgi:nitrate reductase gamma subunit
MSDRGLFVIAPFVSVVLLAIAATFRVGQNGPAVVQPTRSPPAPRSLAFKRRLSALGFVGVLLGHVIMVAWPEQLLKWNRDLSRLVTFEVVLFVFAAASFVAVSAAIRRRVLWPTADAASLADAAFFGVLLVVVASGLGVAVTYRWAAAWSAVTVTRYARSILSVQPNVEPLRNMPYLVKLHIFSSFVAVGLVAFTGLFDAALNSLRRAVGVIVSPFISIVDSQWKPIQQRAFRSARSLMWPEEED